MRFRFKSINRYIGITFFSLYSSTLLAVNGHIYVGGGIDAAFSELSQSTPTINYYNGLLTDFYPLNKNTNTKPEINLNAGYEFINSGMQPAIALGLGVYTTPFAFNFNGKVNEQSAGDPIFPLYHYRTNVSSSRLMAEARLTWFINQFAPYFELGIGPVWNRVSNYSETSATDANFVVPPPFQSQINTRLAYQIGLGVSYLFNFPVCKDTIFKHERISLGYRYAYLGNVSSGIRDGDYSYKLNFGNLTMNSLALTYTHLF